MEECHCSGGSRFKKREFLLSHERGNEAMHSVSECVHVNFSLHLL